MNEKTEILSRVELIEQMIAAGRRSTEYHGWLFILWGVGYLIATGWMSFLPHPDLAWLTTMSVCGLITGVGMRFIGRKQKVQTEVGHGVGAIWIAVGLSFIPAVLCMAAFKSITLPVVFFVVLGIANFASGSVLRWMPQRIVGGLWWICAVALANSPPEYVPWIFVFNALVCQIAFGTYLTVLERRDMSRG